MSTALLTPALAILTVVIAYKQYRLETRQGERERHKIRLDLYDRRYKVFEAVRDVLRIAVGRAKITDEEYNNFSLTAAEGGFLFDKDVNNYVIDIREKLIDLIRVVGELKERENTTPDDDSKRLAAEKAALIRWFMDKGKDVLVVFSPYLAFREIK